MKRKEEHRLGSTDAKNLLEYTIEQALEIDLELLGYMIMKNAQILERDIRIHESELQQLSPNIHIPYVKRRVEKIKKDLDKKKELLDEYSRLDPRILHTIKNVIEELKKNNEEVANRVLKLKLGDIARYDGDPSDNLAVFNYIIAILKNTLPETPFNITIEKPISQAPPNKQNVSEPGVISISEKDFINMNTEEWRSLLDKCFKEGVQLELPENFMSENLRRPLRTFLVSTLEFSPEKLKYIIPRKYKYILNLHRIMFTLLIDGKPMEVTPGSSDREYIEGEGGILEITQATLVDSQSIDNKRRKIYTLKIDDTNYKLIKEIILEDGRAKTIRYFCEKTSA